MYAVIVLGIWLAWQILTQAAVSVGPTSLALRLAPRSPAVLARTAQDELDAGRFEAARRLAGQSLSHAPFNVPALRVAGMAAAREGDETTADRILTLAGNWSLRDDVTHGWLVGRRLRQDRSASALAHADTLMRRRADLRPAYFDMMIAAALNHDVQAQAALVRLLARNPPWRRDFFIRAVRRPEGALVAAATLDALHASDHAVSDAERAQVYVALVRTGRADILFPLRTRLEGEGRPVLTDGGFESGGGTPPFGWRLRSAPGVVAQIAPLSEGRGHALHATLSDLGGRTVAEQLTTLPPGRWRLSARFRVSEGALNDRVAWTVGCASATAGRPLARMALTAESAGAWTTVAHAFEIPPACPAQWLRLTSMRQDRRDQSEIQLDDVKIEPVR